MHVLFDAHFTNIFFIFRGSCIETFFSLETLRLFLVCVIWNSKRFHSLIFKLCIMIVHTLNMCLSFLCNLIIVSYIRFVELRHFFHPKCLGVSVFAISNSSSFHSSKFKLCIIFFHILNMYTRYLRTFNNTFWVFHLEIVTSPTVVYIVQFGWNLISFLYI